MANTPNVKAFTIFGEIALPGVPDSIRDLGNFEKAGQKAASKMLGLSGRSLMIAGGIAAIGTGLLLAGRSAITFSERLETGLRKAAGALPGGIQNLAALRKEVLQLGREIPLATEAIADGMATAARAGSGGVAETTAVFRASFNVAKATSSDLAQAIGGIDTVLDAYNLSAAEAARVSDLFVAAAQRGVQIDDLAPILDRVAAQAQQAGIRLEDLVATIITLREGGVSARQAGAIIANSLAGTRDASFDMESGGRKLAASLEVVNGQIVLTGANSDELAANQRAVAESMGLAQRQAEAMSDSLSDHAQRLVNQVTPAWQGFGRTLSNVAKWILDKPTKWFEYWNPPTAPVSGGVVGMIGRGAQSGAFSGRPAAGPKQTELEDLRVLVEIGRRRRSELLRRLDAELALEGESTEKGRKLLQERAGLVKEMTTEEIAAAQRVAEVNTAAAIASLQAWRTTLRARGDLTVEAERQVDAAIREAASVRNAAIEDELEREREAFRQDAQAKRDLELGWTEFRLRTGAMTLETRIAQIDAEMKQWDTSDARRLELANERFDLVSDLTDREIAKAQLVADTNKQAAVASLEAWRAALKARGELTPAISRQVDTAVQGILKPSASTRNVAQNLGLDLGTAIIDGIATGAYKKKDWLEGVFKQILAQVFVLGLKAFLGIASPSRVMAKLGVQTMEGLGLGLLSHQSNLADAFAQAVSPLTEAGALAVNASAGGGTLSARLQVDKLPKPTDPRQAARDRDWISFMGESTLELQRTGFKA